MSVEVSSEPPVEMQSQTEIASSQNKEDLQSEMTEDEEPIHNSIITNIKKSAAEDTDDTLTDNESPDINENVLKFRSTIQSTGSVDLSVDESIQEFHCQWGECDAIFDKPKQLYLHIKQIHTKDNNKCHWNGCNLELRNILSLMVHIRSHAHYEPYFCTVASCTLNFTNPKDMLNHFKQAHTDESPDLVPWLTHLNETEKWQQYLPNNTNKNAQAANKRYSMIESNIQFVESLDKSEKIDFIKVQNVSIDDIVSEPVRKKGRTANSEINVLLRSTFKEKNDKFKGIISKESKESFDKLERSHIQPLEPDSIIEKASNEELLAIYESLNRKFLWSLEVNELLKKDLKELSQEEKAVWRQKEALLNASIKMEIPSEELNLYT